MKERIKRGLVFLLAIAACIVVIFLFWCFFGMMKSFWIDIFTMIAILANAGEIDDMIEEQIFDRGQQTYEGQ